MHGKSKNNRRTMTILGSALGALAIALSLSGAAGAEQTGTDAATASETTLNTAAPARPMPWDVPALPPEFP